MPRLDIYYRMRSPINRSGTFLAPAVTVGETEGAMDSSSVRVFISFFAYYFVRK